jgi:hypothetical protein
MHTMDGAKGVSGARVQFVTSIRFSSPAPGFLSPILSFGARNGRASISSISSGMPLRGADDGGGFRASNPLDKGRKKMQMVRWLDRSIDLLSLAGSVAQASIYTRSARPRALLLYPSLSGRRISGICAAAAPSSIFSPFLLLPLGRP